MPSLLDTLDRFNYNTSSIQSTISSRSNEDVGPFTTAMLHASLQNIIREADEAEYGLFTFVKDSINPVNSISNQGKVGRKEFRGATPLKPRRAVGTARDEEPEVYVEAALKYMERFRAIKPFSHVKSRLESLISRLNHIRDNMERLQSSIDETAQNGLASPKSQIIEEERRISELKSRILQLRKRREALAAKLPSRGQASSKSNIRSQPKAKMDSPSTSCVSSADSTPQSQLPKPKITVNRKSNTAHLSKPTPGVQIFVSQKSTQRKATAPQNRRMSQDDDTEHLFWSGRKPNGLSKADSLLTEELDMAGIDSLMSPSPIKKKSSIRTNFGSGEKIMTHSSVTPTIEPQGDQGDDNEDDSDSGEPTIVVSKLLHLPSVSEVVSNPTIESSPHSSSQTPNIGPQTPGQPGNSIDDTTVPPSTNKGKIRRIRITAEIERICTKIWNTIADLLVPGNNFSAPGKHPPNGKDTIAILQAIASQPIPDPTSMLSSPSAHSTLSSILGTEIIGTENTPHQIMTAQVLLSLFNAPNHKISLMALKTVLASKTALPSLRADATAEEKQAAAANEASNAQLGTRALYGCRAKKLIKIDRSGTEQIVKFDA